MAQSSQSDKQTETTRSMRSIFDHAFHRRLLMPVIIIGVVLLLGGIYFGMEKWYVHQIDAKYAARDCTEVVRVSDILEKAFPRSKDADLAEKTKECGLYVEACEHTKQAEWPEAYQDFNDYSTRYPNGLYPSETRTSAAKALCKWAADQKKAQAYEGAVKNLSLVLDEYADTPSATEAEQMLPEAYVGWAGMHQEQGSFDEAEAILTEYRSWAMERKDRAETQTASIELSMNYLKWGKYLESNKDFPSALQKISRASATDPVPDSPTGPAALAHEYLPEFYNHWADALISEKKYQEAVTRFEYAITGAEAEDKSVYQDGLSSVYIRWAEALTLKEDFVQALEKSDLAIESAGSNMGKILAEEARTNTLEQFANSEGAQAQELIAGTTTTICENKSDLEISPAIGIGETVAATIQGLDVNMAGEIIARNPGSLHYVVCITPEESRKVFMTCRMITKHWTVLIRDARTGKVVNSHKFTGSKPPECDINAMINAMVSKMAQPEFRYGSDPSAQELEDWLRSVIK
jgi:tetratricopeptide (TPR) repeat protein